MSGFGPFERAWPGGMPAGYTPNHSELNKLDENAADAGNLARMKPVIVDFTTVGESEFDPADYPWAKFARVLVVGGGGGGAGGTADNGRSSGPGGGSGYPAEDWVVLADMEGPATVIVGDGGAGGTPGLSGDLSGGNGQESSFTFGEYAIIAEGGEGGQLTANGARGGNGYSGGGADGTLSGAGDKAGDGGTRGEDGGVDSLLGENVPGEGAKPLGKRIGLPGGAGGEKINTSGNGYPGGGGGGGLLPGTDAQDGESNEGEGWVVQGGRGGKGYGAGGGGGANGQYGGKGAQGIVRVFLF